MYTNKEKDYIQTLKEMMKNNKGVPFEALLEEAKKNLLAEEQRQKNTEILLQAVKELKRLTPHIAIDLTFTGPENPVLTITCQNTGPINMSELLTKGLL